MTKNFYIMQSAVESMQSKLPCYTPLTNHATAVHTVPMVFASDCDTLREDRDSHQRVCIAVMEERDTLRTANQRLEQEVSKLKAVMANQSARQFVGHDDQRHIDDLVAAGIRASDAEMKRLEGEVARLKGQIEGLKDTIAGAEMWIRDVTDVVLFPLSREVQGGLGAEADGFGGHTPELLRSIDAALRGKGGG